MNDFLKGLMPPDVTDKATVAAFNQGAHQIKDLAANGGFAINETGMTSTPSSATSSWTATRPRNILWFCPYAHKVADHNVRVATGDEHSLIPNLDLMKDGYEQLKEAFQIARRNYRETEAEHDQTFRKINPE